MAMPPSLAEVKTAIAQLKNHKAAGPDDIPGELLKCGGPALYSVLHTLFLLVWENQTLPSDLRDANIVTIFKKGDRGVCGNYRGISLLSTTGKVLSRILLNRLASLAERILPESQAGFRQERGTTDMVFCARQLLEKAREQRRPVYLVFFDLEKAFDLVPRDILWKVLAKFGCPSRFVNVVRLLHDDMKGSVTYKGKLSPPFDIRCGVKQGCVLAPTLFSMYMAAMLMKLRRVDEHGISVRYRHDGSLFNLSRLRARSKTSSSVVLELQYADDAAAPASSEENLQSTVDAFVNAYELFGLRVSIKKTKVLAQVPPNYPNPPLNVRIHGELVEQVNRFTYLGSVLDDGASLEHDLENRIKAAYSAFGRLGRRVFYNHELTTRTKLMVYRAVVLPTLLYGSESWTLYGDKYEDWKRSTPENSGQFSRLDGRIMCQILK